MEPSSTAELYSPEEIARAAGVPVDRVIAALSDGGRGSRSARYVPHPVAVRIGRALVQTHLFSIFAGASGDLRSRPVFAISSTLQAVVIAAIIAIATLNVAPEVAAVRRPGDVGYPPTAVQLVFLATPGPGGGGGGGGLLQQPEPPPPAKIEGTKTISSPIRATPPVHIAPPQRPI